MSRKINTSDLISLRFQRAFGPEKRSKGELNKHLAPNVNCWRSRPSASGGCAGLHKVPSLQPGSPQPCPLSYVMFPFSGAELFSLAPALRRDFLCLIGAQSRGLFAAAAGGTKPLPRLLVFFFFLRGGMNHEPRTVRAFPAPLPHSPGSPLTSLFNPSLPAAAAAAAQQDPALPACCRR